MFLLPFFPAAVADATASRKRDREADDDDDEADEDHTRSSKIHREKASSTSFRLFFLASGRNNMYIQ